VRDTFFLQLCSMAGKDARAESRRCTTLPGTHRPTSVELIGQFRWAVEIGRVNILLETSLLSSYLAMPRVGHLEQEFHIFGYLQTHPKRKIGFDPSHPEINKNRFQKCDWEEFYRDASEAIPENKPEPQGKSMSMHCFVDANHARDMETR
jgi:hypothetical protein